MWGTVFKIGLNLFRGYPSKFKNETQQTEVVLLGGPEKKEHCTFRIHMKERERITTEHTITVGRKETNKCSFSHKIATQHVNINQHIQQRWVNFDIIFKKEITGWTNQQTRREVTSKRKRRMKPTHHTSAIWLSGTAHSGSDFFERLVVRVDKALVVCDQRERRHKNCN